MLNLHQSFGAGFYTVQAGVYFHIIDICAMFENHPAPEVRELALQNILRIQEAHAPPFVRTIGKIHDLAERAGFAPPAPPRIPTEYFEWANTITRQFASLVDPDSSEELALSIGYHVGEVLCALNVLIPVFTFRLKDPHCENLVKLTAKLQNHICHNRDELIPLSASPRTVRIFSSLIMNVLETAALIERMRLHPDDLKSLVLQIRQLQESLEDLGQSVKSTLLALETIPLSSAKTSA